jgi:hypothetical protein
MNHPLDLLPQPALSAFFSPVYGVYIGIIAVDRAGKVASDNTSTTFSYAAGCSAGLRKDKPGLDFVPKNAELPDKSSVDVPYVDKHAFERKHRLKT